MRTGLSKLQAFTPVRVRGFLQDEKNRERERENEAREEAGQGLCYEKQYSALRIRRKGWGS